MLYALYCKPTEPGPLGSFQVGTFPVIKPLIGLLCRKIGHVLAEWFSWKKVRSIRDPSNVVTDQADVLVECACADLKTAPDELPRLKGNGLWEDISATNQPSHGFQTSEWVYKEGRAWGHAAGCS